MASEGCGMKWPWPDLRHYPVGTAETTKVEASPCTGRDTEGAASELDLAGLLLRQHSR